MAALNALVITVSDRVSRGEAEDRSGPAAVAGLATLGITSAVQTVPDGVAPVADALRQAVREGVPLVVTTGGTGFGPHDHTPEATLEVVERLAPGLPEAIRADTFGANPHGMLSRGVAGIAGSTLIVNLPGSVGAVDESLEVIGPALEHALSLLADEPTPHGAEHKSR